MGGGSNFSASKPGTSKQPEDLDPTPSRAQSSAWADEAMDVDLYGPSFPPHRRGKQSIQDSDPRHHLGDNQSMHESDLRHVSDEHSGHSEEPSRVVHKKMLIKENTRLVPDTHLHLQRKISPLYTNIGLPSPLGLLLIKTNLNMTQVLFSMGK